MTETVISSFILRFTQETDIDAPWRGVVRHVQSDEEARFTRIDEALRFIGRYIELDRMATGLGSPECVKGTPAADQLPALAVLGRGQ